MTTSSQNSITSPFCASLLTGGFYVLLTNPIDKSFFGMIKEKKKFTEVLFKNPYQGLALSGFNRCISYGGVYAFKDSYENYFKQHITSYRFASDIATGVTTVALTHPFSAVKMYGWSHQYYAPFYPTLKKMIHELGIESILRAINLTTYRDTLFISVYFHLSERYNKEKAFINNVAFGCLATMLSSPVNYARNRAFFDFYKPQPSLSTIFSEVHAEMIQKETGLKKISFIAFEKLYLGHNTLRVGFGMAGTHKFYQYLVSERPKIKHKQN